MNKTDVYHALTLWFVAAIFLQTGSGNTNPLVGVMAFVAIAVTYLVPLYLLVGVFRLLTEE